MAKQRKVKSLLAVPVLSALAQYPMYPYQIASLLKERGKDQSVKINWGSLYTVVQNLEKNGFIEAIETRKEGRQPERTVYRITDEGREELLDWLRELIGEPEREHTRLEAGLSYSGFLHPDEVVRLLQHRLAALEDRIAQVQGEIDEVTLVLPRIFLIETEFHLTMLRAEAEWIRGTLTEMADGSRPDIQAWRHFHETGEMPPEYAELFEEEARKYQ